IKMKTTHTHSSHRTASTNIQTWKAVITKTAGLVRRNSQLARSEIRDAKRVLVGAATSNMLKTRQQSAACQQTFSTRLSRGRQTLAPRRGLCYQRAVKTSPAINSPAPAVLRRAYTLMSRRFGHQHWWPGDT